MSQIYGQVQAPIDLYVSPVFSLTPLTLNLKQKLFYSSVETFITRGLNVAYNPLTYEITISKGAAICNTALIILDNDITFIAFSSTPPNCFHVIMVYDGYNDARIIVADEFYVDSLQPNEYVYLACVQNNVVLYPTSPLNACCRFIRYDFYSISQLKFLFNSIELTITNNTNVFNTQYVGIDRRYIFVQLNGILLQEGLDFVINGPYLTFNAQLIPGDVLHIDNLKVIQDTTPAAIDTTVEDIYGNIYTLVSYDNNILINNSKITGPKHNPVLRDMYKISTYYKLGVHNYNLTIQQIQAITAYDYILAYNIQNSNLNIIRLFDGNLVITY